MSFLVVLPSVLGLTLMSILAWFCLRSWDNSDGCREILVRLSWCHLWWAFPAWFWRMSWELRYLCPKKAAWCWEKKWGETSAVPIFHLGSPRKTDSTKCQVSFGKLRKKLFFGGLGGARFPGPSKVANCQSVEDCKKYIIFRDIDGATASCLGIALMSSLVVLPRWKCCLLSFSTNARAHWCKTLTPTRCIGITAPGRHNGETKGRQRGERKGELL